MLQKTKTWQSSGQLWLWSVNTDELTSIVVSSNGFLKYPSSLLPLPNKQHIVVGWSNGDLSLFDIECRGSVWNIHAHGRTVNSLMMYSRREEYILSLADDNCIKMWCVKRLLKAAEKEHEVDRQDNTAHSRATDDGNYEVYHNVSVSLDSDNSNSTNDLQTIDHNIDVDLNEPDYEEVNYLNDNVVLNYERDKRRTSETPAEDDTESGSHDDSAEDTEFESAFVPSVAKRNTFKSGAKLVSKLMLFGRSATTQKLDPSEQCVDANVFGSHLITATPYNRQASKFWHLTTGILDSQVSSNFNDLYNESLNAQGITYGNRYHAQILCFANYLVYILKKTNAMTLFISRIINDKITILAHVHIPESYFSHIEYQSFTQESDPLRIYIVRTSTLEIRNFRLEILETIDLPNIADEINNLTSVLSSANKKKILNYRVSITSDNKFFVIINPTPGGKAGRYFDIVDLERNIYLGRSTFGVDVPWIVSDGVYYLILPTIDRISKDIISKSKLLSIRKLSETFEKQGLLESDLYCSILRSDNQQLSPDGLFVAEFAHDYVIHVWRIADRRPKMLVSLVGHVAQVTCVSWLTSSGVLVSGSHDSSVRLWSLSAGSQLCLFHVYGAVDNIRFSDQHDLAAGRFVVVHCSYAPFRKRAVILKVSNIA